MSQNFDRRRFLSGALSAAAAAGIGPRTLHAGAAPAGQGGFSSTEIAPGVWCVEGAGTLVVSVVGPDGQVLVDNGSADRARGLLDHLQWRRRAVKAAFNTHWHWNHTGGNLLLGQAGVPIIAHENTRLWMQRPIVVPWEQREYPPVAKAALPTKTFYTTGQMSFGPHEIRYGHLGQAHTDGDLYVHLPASNVLVVGGVLATERWPVMDYATGGWIGGLLEANRQLLKLADERTLIVQGLGPVATRAQLQAQADMLEKLKESIWQLMRKGLSDREIVAARPTAEYEAKLGDPTQFILSAYKGLWGHVREQRGVV